MFKRYMGGAKTVMGKIGRMEEAVESLNRKMKNYHVYLHHGKSVVVPKKLKGKHRQYCLCHSCNHFQPWSPQNCSIAQENLAMDQKWNIVTPVWECPHFVPDCSAIYDGLNPREDKKLRRIHEVIMLSIFLATLSAYAASLIMGYSPASIVPLVIIIAIMVDQVEPEHCTTRKFMRDWMVKNKELECELISEAQYKLDRAERLKSTGKESHKTWDFKEE